MENAVNLLSQLKDIHLPENSGWWPPAPGWWIVTVIALTLIWLLARFILRYQRNRKPGKEIRQQLMSLDINCPQDQKPAVLQNMSRLVRQYAISQYGREKVAALNGDDWLEFLESTASTAGAKRDIEFKAGIGQALGNAPFQKQCDTNLNQLRALLMHWSKSVKHV